MARHGAGLVVFGLDDDDEHWPDERDEKEN
jgi:hypothetical protein